ncbi:MAG: hypothetical protein ACHREM_30075, partial [Polyangiales bacterium]
SGTKPSCGSTCPGDVAPTAGAPCTGPTTCAFSSPCGLASATCDDTTSYWALSMPTCEGPCPAAEPAAGGTCLASMCSYTSACGANDVVWCTNGLVTSIDVGVCPACPATRPDPETSCGSPMTCDYTNSCGATDVATCPGGSMAVWTVLRGICK